MPARENMPVQVKYRLAAVFTRVGNDAKTFFNIFTSDDFFQRRMHRQCRRIVKVEHVFHMPARYQQNMTGRNGIYISERKCLIIGINLRRGNFTRH